VPGFVLFVVLIVLTACGKVGDLQPPFIRIPEAIRDLNATQIGLDVVLTWTNPARYIDGSAATDLATVILAGDGVVIANLAPTGAGKPQSYTIPARSWLTTSRSFTARLVTERGRTSELATTNITPVDVPGGVVDLTAVVDQYALTLTWRPPAEGGQVVDGYWVTRLDRQQPPVLQTELQFKDDDYERGAEYRYQVTAVRRWEDKIIPGFAPQEVTIRAVDVTPPKTPTGLSIVASDRGAYVTWDPNEELDLAGYHVFRNDRLISSDLRTTNSFEDPDYRPGVKYAVSAVDEFGNESPPSANHR
jgi:hypothetical protein